MTANSGPERSLTVSNGLPNESHKGHPLLALCLDCLSRAEDHSITTALQADRHRQAVKAMPRHGR